MIRHTLSFTERYPILTLGGSIAVLTLILLVLAMSGFFLPAFIIPLFTLFGLSMGTGFFFFWKQRSLQERLGLILIGILLITAVSLSHIEPTVFTGRDQGSISMAATLLAQSHHLAFHTPLATDFFAIYGKGEALHFPGFFYTTEGSIITKFPLGYTVFLSAFFQTFGIPGFMIANSILLFASFLILFTLLRTHAPRMTWVGLILFSTSLIPLFLMHLTLTENFALFLFLFLAHQTTEFLREPRRAAFFGAIFTALLFPFIRIEGFAFLSITILLLCATKESRKFIRENIRERCLLPGILFLSLFIATAVANTPFYRVMGKEILKPFTIESAGNAETSFLALPSLLSLYGMLSIFIAGLIGMFILIRARKWSLLIPIFIALPTCIYLLSPSITPDHPWMLRRFLFSIWPALLITFLFALEFLLEQKKLLRKIAFFLPMILLLGQMPAFFSLLTPNDTPKLLPQITSFAGHFSGTDRILIDRNVTGDGFNMISGPLVSLFHLDAAYFFNPIDMKKLPFREGITTYLLIPEKRLSLYQDNIPDFKLVPRQTMDFSTSTREALPVTTFRFPQIVTQKEKVMLVEVIPLF